MKNTAKKHENTQNLWGIDEVDQNIIELLEENPDMTHNDIAQEVSRSQPAVGARIAKLKQRNVLATQVGINFKKVDLKLGLATFCAKHVDRVMQKLKENPFIINVFKTSGTTNMLALVGARDLKTIDMIVDKFLRQDPDLSNITLNLLIKPLKDLVLPFNFIVDEFPKIAAQVPADMDEAALELPRAVTIKLAS